MNNSRRPTRGAKTSTGRASRGPGRSSAPQNASPPTTSLKSLQGLYANQHFVHVASVARGCTAELQVKSGKKFEGILTTVSPMGEVELRLAHPVDSGDNSGIPPQGQVTEKLLFAASSIVCINIKDVDMDYASRGVEVFQTDAEISRRQNGQVSDRELEAFETDVNLGDVGLTDDPLASGSSNGWSAEEMFKKNELMGVTSSYDKKLEDYTTPLDVKDTDDYQKRIKRADRLAKQIEGSNEYMVRVNKELECSEEDKFSAVVRPLNSQQPGRSSSSSPVSASSNADSLNATRYVAPALRKQQGESHRNHTRAIPPTGVPQHTAGRNRAQSPHMHPSHQQQGQQPPPHGMSSPQQRVQQTSPQMHPAARNPQMPHHLQSQQQASHMGANPRSPSGIPQSQQPLPQRIPSSGRRTAPDVGPGNAVNMSPVQFQALAAAKAATVDKQSNVDKPRDGAGPQDVDKKTPEASQPQRVIPPMDRNPRTSMNETSKKQTIEHLKEFGDNFRLPDAQQAAPQGATTTTQVVAPGTAAQAQEQQQKAPPVGAAASQPSAQPPTQPVPPQDPMASPAHTTPASPTVAPAVASTTQAPVTPSSTTTTSSVTKPTDKPTTPTTLTAEEKKDAFDAIKKSTLNPNAKEFNPLAKPFVPTQRMPPQKTPTPPRPPSQPSPAPQAVMPGQYTQQLNQPIYQVPIQQQNIHYASIRNMGPRKGATNLPQLRGHGQHDIQHILPVSMAAGQPLVAPVPAGMLPFATHQAGPGGPVSAAQTINHSQVISQQHGHLVYHQQKPMAQRLAQQNMVAAGQPGSHGQHQHQHQISQDGPVMVFPQMISGLNTFQHSGNIPISQQAHNQMPTPYHQFSQPQPGQQPGPGPQPQPHHPSPQVHIQQAHQQPHQQSHGQHPHGGGGGQGGAGGHQQHTTPPLAHTPQGQAPGSVMQQPQPAHGGRPSPSPVNQVMHQANQQQQQQHQQQQQQQHQQFHPQTLQAMGQPQPQNPQMMATMAAVNHQQGGGAGGGSPHSVAGNHHNHQQQQQQNMMSQMHAHPAAAHHVIHTYPQAHHPNITNVTPVHSAPHPHPKQVFLHSTQGQHGGVAGGQQGIQAIPMHPQQSILSSPVQGPYMHTQPGQLQQAQVQQFQPGN